MDQFLQAQSNIPGRYSGNAGNNNVFGSNNITTNIYGSLHMTNSGVGNRGGDLGTVDSASRPYRLIPYCRNSTFTGRKDLLESVKRFAECKGHNRIALHGLGGSGKTQIALEYVYQRAGESGCDIFWVQGSGILKFGEGFRAIAQRVRIPWGRAEADEEAFLLGIRRWFEGRDSGDWILVIDNADNEADFVGNNSPLSKFIPQGGKGTLIFTTRSRQVASRQRCQMIEVGKMGEEEAQELFSQRLGSWDSLVEEEKAIVAMILGWVDHLPLAVIGLAAFMTETATPPSLYWAIFQENEERMRNLLSQEFCDIQREVDVTESILGTHFVTFDRIGQQMPLAADILRLMAFFDRQNIPEEFLSQSGLDGMGDSIGFRLAIGKLLAFSLVTVVKCENKTFYELHRLVQLSLQAYFSTEDLGRWRASALQVISRLFPRDQNERRSIGPTYIQHALAVAKDSTDPIAEELCFRMGQYFLDMGLYNHAEIQFCRCIALREEVKEYDWDNEGDWRLTHLGLANAYQGEYDESEARTRRALEGLERVLGLDHPNTLTGVNNLAIVLRFRGKYDESETINRRALERREKVLGPDHPNTLESVNNLATVLLDQGNCHDSEAMNRRVLEVREILHGPLHPDTLESVNNLSEVLWSQGKYNESEIMIRRALEAREMVLGPDHPETLTSLGNLAAVLERQGNFYKAEKIFRRALEGYEKVLGPDHPDTLLTVYNLAQVLYGEGEYDESETMNWRALEGWEKDVGPDHPNTLSSLCSLAGAPLRKEKYDESEMMNRRALEGQEEVLGPDHPDTLISVSNLAEVLSAQGKYKESEAMHRRALEGYEKVLGPDHPHTLISVHNLALVLQSQGMYDESETMHRRALEGRKKALGPDHPYTRSTVTSLASVLRIQGKYHDSEMMNRRTRQGLLRKPDWMKPRFSLRRFLTATVLGKEVRPTD